MTVLVDTSVLVDVLRGVGPAVDALVGARRTGPLHSSVVVRAEVLAGMRPREADATHELLRTLVWHDVTTNIADEAGTLGRRWLPSHRGIDSADLLIAATATHLDAELLTANVRHFPMFPDLQRPY